MELQILGSGAADGIPGLFSNDRVSSYARLAGGKDVRTRCSALLDGILKIDFGPDTYHQVIANRLDPSKWLAILFTHSHEDHICVAEIQYALYPFVETQEAPFAIYGNQKVLDQIKNRYPEWPLELHLTQSFVSFEIGAYHITPVAANHDDDEDCQNFLFANQGTKILYATDTGLWKDRTWEFLTTVQLDGLVIECTDGLNPSGYSGHLSVESCVWTVEELRKRNILKRGASVVTTHHSHNGNATHNELVAALAPHRIEPSYDGLLFHCDCNAQSPYSASNLSQSL